MQGSGAIGFQSRDLEADDDSSSSVSGFQFGGAWAELNTNPAGNLVDVERYLPGSRIQAMAVPLRPSTPVGGLSTNLCPRDSSPRELITGNPSKQDDLKHPGRNVSYTTTRNKENADLDNAQSNPRSNDRDTYSGSTNTNNSITKPLVANKSGKLPRSASQNNVGTLVAKLSSCTTACDRLNLQLYSDDSQSPSCLRTGSRYFLGAQGEKQYSVSSSDQLAKLWVMKHRPESLTSFVINCRQAQELKHLISGGHCHHLLFQGPPGCGKKCLILALLRDVFGVSAWLTRDFTRRFDIEGTQVSLPMTSSAHHVELNLVHAGVHLRLVLSTLLKEIKLSCTSDDNDSFAWSYKVLVLHDVDKVSVEAQKQIRWLMDRYSDYCKFILLCLEPSKIFEAVRSRCIVVDVSYPTVEEIVQVLYFVAKREDLELPKNFAWRIAKASTNARQAVLTLEACKLKRYPFDENQLIVTEWEKDIVSIARDIIDQQNPRRLYRVRGKIQALLDEGVAAKLILWGLVEELVKLVDIPLRDEINQWAKFYAKKLPDGIDALFKLEEFVAKLMSLYKKFG